MGDAWRFQYIATSRALSNKTLKEINKGFSLQKAEFNRSASIIEN